MYKTIDDISYFLGLECGVTFENNSCVYGVVQTLNSYPDLKSYVTDESTGPENFIVMDYGVGPIAIKVSLIKKIFKLKS